MAIWCPHAIRVRRRVQHLGSLHWHPTRILGLSDFGTSHLVATHLFPCRLLLFCRDVVLVGQFVVQVLVDTVAAAFLRNRTEHNANANAHARQEVEFLKLHLQYHTHDVLCVSSDNVTSRLMFILLS